MESLYKILGFIFLIYMVHLEKKIIRKVEKEKEEITSHGLDPEFFKKPSERVKKIRGSDWMCHILEFNCYRNYSTFYWF